MSIQLSEKEAADLETLREGGQQARAEFFERHRKQLKEMARFRMDPRVKRRVSESDIIQDVFFKYSEEIEPYLAEVVLPPKVWLRRLVRRVIWGVNRHHIERQCRDTRREHDLDTLSRVRVQELTESLSSVGKKIDRKQLQKKMREIVSKMPKYEREILTLVHFEDQSIREAAMELDIEYEAAKKRYRRSLKRLKNAHQAALQEYIG
ncbi:MAG: sigma-70 family RNA polymerase sigma factor [Planctomycetota bacterium]